MWIMFQPSGVLLTLSTLPAEYLPWNSQPLNGILPAATVESLGALEFTGNCPAAPIATVFG